MNTTDGHDCPYHVRLHPDERCTCLPAPQPLTPRDTLSPGRYIEIVIDGPPSHISGRFVEVEDERGRGLKIGEWTERAGNYWALRIPGDQLEPTDPVPMLLYCPGCNERHIDEGEFATKPHHTHACQRCGFVWRPGIVATVGVRFLPGFKDVPANHRPPKMETVQCDNNCGRAAVAAGVCCMRCPDHSDFCDRATIGAPRSPATPASAPATPQTDPGACSCCGAASDSVADVLRCVAMHKDRACPNCDATPTPPPDARMAEIAKALEMHEQQAHDDTRARFGRACCFEAGQKSVTAIDDEILGDDACIERAVRNVCVLLHDHISRDCSIHQSEVAAAIREARKMGVTESVIGALIREELNRG